MMLISSLDNQFIRPPGKLFFRFNNSVVKIPLSAASVVEKRIEMNAIDSALKDVHFLKHVPAYHHYFGMQVAPYIRKLSSSDADMRGMKEYFRRAFTGHENWSRENISNLVQTEPFIRFVHDFIPSKSHFWSSYILDCTMPASSAHGDFHPGNILVSDSSFFFIDWVRYSPQSSRFFDLIDFYIFSKKLENQSWMHMWGDMIEQQVETIFSISTPKEYLVGYALWKTAEELKTLYDRNALNQYKVKKYVAFVDCIKQAIGIQI